MKNIIYNQILTEAQQGTEDKITVLKKLEEVFPDDHKKIISDSISFSPDDVLALAQQLMDQGTLLNGNDVI